jgi:hypothetical protein
MSATFYQLHKVVSSPWVKDVDKNDNPVVNHSGMLRQKSVNPLFVSSKGFHNPQMMQFIPRLCKVNL